MPPITMMRNALGKEEGGSGVKLDREKERLRVCYTALFKACHPPVQRG